MENKASRNETQLGGNARMNRLISAKWPQNGLCKVAEMYFLSLGQRIVITSEMYNPMINGHQLVLVVCPPPSPRQFVYDCIMSVVMYNVRNVSQ